MILIIIITIIILLKRRERDKTQGKQVISTKLGDFILISLIPYSWFLSFSGFRSVIFSYRDGFWCCFIITQTFCYIKLSWNRGEGAMHTLWFAALTWERERAIFMREEEDMWVCWQISIFLQSQISVVVNGLRVIVLIACKYGLFHLCMILFCFVLICKMW